MTTWRTAFLGLLVTALVACAACAADAPKQPDWPALPTVPDKPAKVDPAQVQSLREGELYVVGSDSPVQLLASPAGRVSITERAGPRDVYGVFVDGAGKPEFRTYQQKQVFFVERVLPGSVELLMVPKGDVQRRTITDDQNPIPPPKPVEPKPDEPKPVVEKSPWDNAPGLRVLIVYPKRGALPASQQSIVTGKRVRDYLDTKTVKEGTEAAYWILKTDEDVTGLPATWQAAYSRAKSRTWIVVGNGARWEEGPLPENPDKALELLKKYGDTFGGP